MSKSSSLGSAVPAAVEPAKTAVIVQALGLWFERQSRVLPWRDDPSIYRVWISEIMLQQTQVISVIPFFERFMTAFPTVEILAAASPDAVNATWAGLGYYSRARNLHRAAKQVVEAGGFPQSREGWLDLPGVGPYTAGAILSIALNQVEALVDGNVERVISRLRCLLRESEVQYKAALWSEARALVESGAAAGVAPRVLNQSLMELGAMICTPRKPKCLVCPVREHCEAWRTQSVESFPEKKKRPEWKRVAEVLHCWVDEGGRVLLRKRQTGEWRAGLWDLVEAPPPAELRPQELGMIEGKYVVTRHKVARKTFVWRVRAGGSLARRRSLKETVWRAADVQSGEEGAEKIFDDKGKDVQWVPLADLQGFALGAPSKRTLMSVQEKFPGLSASGS